MTSPPRLSRIFIPCLIALAFIGCRKSGNSPEYKVMVEQVEAGELDVIDYRKTPGVGDDQLIELANAPGANKLKELILDDSTVTDTGVKALPWLSNLTFFSASKTQITDSGVAHLPKVGNLHSLRLDQTRTTDLSLQTIGQMKSLRSLSLWRCAITDQGLPHLKGLSRLESLSLDETGVTAAGLRRLLPELPSLQYLSVWKTKVRPNDLDSLREHHPGLKINIGS